MSKIYPHFYVFTASIAVYEFESCNSCSSSCHTFQKLCTYEYQPNKEGVFKFNIENTVNLP